MLHYLLSEVLVIVDGKHAVAPLHQLTPHYLIPHHLIWVIMR